MTVCIESRDCELTILSGSYDFKRDALRAVLLGLHDAWAAHSDDVSDTAKTDRVEFEEGLDGRK